MRVRPAGAAVLVAVVLTVSACGSSSGSGGAAATTTAAPLGSAASTLSSATSVASGAASSAASAAAGAASSARSAISSAVVSATGADGATAAGAFDVCTILPFALAAQLSGQPYTQGTATSSDGLYGCAYDNADATVPGLNVTILQDESGDTWSAVHTGAVTDISGLGDKALWDNDNTLYAVKGHYVVQVNGDELTQAPAEALVKPVLAALP